MRASSETQPKLETWLQGEWRKPFANLDKLDLKTTIIKRGFLFPSGETITFFIHDMDFPENVRAKPKRKSFVVTIDNTSREIPYELMARINKRPQLVYIGIPDLEDRKMVYEDWEKENPTVEDRPNPFTCSFAELKGIEVKIT